jgi:hypothetical protein
MANFSHPSVIRPTGLYRQRQSQNKIVLHSTSRFMRSNELHHSDRASRARLWARVGSKDMGHRRWERSDSLISVNLQDSKQIRSLRRVPENSTDWKDMETASWSDIPTLLLHILKIYWRLRRTIISRRPLDNWYVITPGRYLKNEDIPTSAEMS